MGYRNIKKCKCGHAIVKDRWAKEDGEFLSKKNKGWRHFATSEDEEKGLLKNDTDGYDWIITEDCEFDDCDCTNAKLKQV